MDLLGDILGLIYPKQPAMLTTPDIRAAAAEAAAPEELQLTDECEQMIERDEGCVLDAYPDPATGGDPWTIGYGHTGPDVHPGLVITQTDAHALLEKDLEKFEDGVLALLGYPHGIGVGASLETTDEQFSAMVSLAFNVGLGNFEKSSVLRFHNAGQYPQAADAFLLWDKAAGQVMPGLVRRRHQEREMYLGLAIDP